MDLDGEGGQVQNTRESQKCMKSMIGEFEKITEILNTCFRIQKQRNKYYKNKYDEER
ncbi:unnamed protein product [Paramecium sonneborni]|uniref:Uncharacterized protein n=1 Tax=Paramecium sonneborni TaxID=65129 RepID=A0A8S1QMD8_9CILI|nr:unnamed protein product [Paramecium sonneborni]